MPSRIRIALHEKMKERHTDALAYRESWELERVIKRTADQPREVIWAVPRRKTFVHVIEDFLIQQRYVRVDGADAVAVAALVRSKLKTLSPADVAGRLDGAREESDVIDALYEAGVVAGPEEDPVLTRVFRAGLEHESAQVRRAAIFAAGYAEWRSFEAWLAELAEADVDPIVREDARAMLDGLAKVWGGAR